MISQDSTGKKKYSMNPQIGKAMAGPSPVAKPAAGPPGLDAGADDGSGTPVAAEPLNVTCPTCGAQIPVTADNLAQPEPDADDASAGTDLSGMSADQDMA